MNEKSNETIVAFYGLTNNHSITIHEADSDYVMAGVNGQDIRELEVFHGYDEALEKYIENFNQGELEELEYYIDGSNDEPFFIYGHLIIPLSECIRADM